MRVLLRSTVCAVFWCVAFSSHAWAAEITLRMRGGSFEIKGELKSFNLKTYVVTSPGLGTLSLDATRYECVGANCPGGAVEPRTVAAPPLTPVTTTWVGGSAIGTEFMPRLIRAYAERINANVAMNVGADPKDLEFKLTSKEGRFLGQVNVRRQGVPQGFAAMAKGQTDVVWTSRAILPEEQQMMAAAGQPNMLQPGNQHVFALDALVVVVARENPVVSLSLDNIAKIFAGEITDWGQVGLPPGKINVYAPSAEMGSWTYFEQAILSPRGLKVSTDAVRLSHATEWTDRVAADPAGIGINSIAYVRKAKAVNIETPCGIVVPPSIFAAKTEEYPMARRLYFYSPGQPQNPLARALLEFALSAELQPILKEAKFVDQAPESLPFIAHTGRIAVALNAPAEDFDPVLMRQLIEDFRAAERISLTFRFQGGASTLDERARQDLARLRSVLQRRDMQGNTVMLSGYSDAVGSFAANLTLSKRRAQAVRAALFPAGSAPPAGVTIEERAFGELAPVACNDTNEGRGLNRRVEVWIR
jgi:phosphate transport system substrate-binding protein